MAKNEYGEAVIKWVTITVLVAVSLFFVVLYRNVFANNTDGLNDNTLVNNDNSAEAENEDDINEEEEPPVIIPVISYSTFPRVAITSSNGEFYCNTGGTGNETLKDVIDLGGFYYLILETNSNGKDYKADRDYVAVAKFSYDGTLTQTITLTANRNEYYMASKIMSNGILIATSGSGGITYYIVSFDLTYSKAVTSENYSEIKLYYTREYVLSAGANGKFLTVAAIDNSLNKVFSNSVEFEAAVSVIDIFPSVYGFTIVVNVESETPCTYLTSINNGGDLLSKSLVSTSHLLKISPISNGYALLEKSGQSLYLKTVNNSLVQQFRTLIGEGTGGDFYTLSNGYIVFIYSDTGAVSKHLCKFGEIITTNDVDFADITAINSFSFTEDSIYFYADIVSLGGTRDTRVINYTNKNLVTYTEILGGYYQDYSAKVIIKNNLIVTFMTTNSNNTGYMSNYGGSDIFILAKVKS